MLGPGLAGARLQARPERRDGPMDRRDEDAIRSRVLSALGDNRVRGYSFLAHLLRLGWPRIGTDSLVMTMDAGPHGRDPDGRVSLIALCGMLDIGLATAPRLSVGPAARQATVQLHLQFTGAPAKGPLALEAAFEGFSAGHALRQAFSRGVVACDGVPVCRASGAFVPLPPPPGVELGPLPWERTPSGSRPAPDPGDLDTEERAVLDACDRALASARNGRSFIEAFLGVTPEQTPEGAQSVLTIGPQHGNRVGDVQGGLLLAMAAATAQAATPAHPVLSTLSASFLSPGRGEKLRIRSEILHAGRSLAATRTQIRSTDGKLALDAVCRHAA